MSIEFYDTNAWVGLWPLAPIGHADLAALRRHWRKQGIQGGDSTAAGGATDAATRAMSVATSGLSKYRDNCVEDNLKMWALWIPGDLIVYAVPIWIRMPLNHGFLFIWTCYLSFLRGDDDAKCNPATASANRGAGKLPWTASGIAPERTLGD